VANAATIAIGITFRDRDGNRAKATCYCAFAVPQSDAWSLANGIADRMQAISNALLWKIDLTWRYTIDSPAAPALDSTNERKILMLITNEDDEINAIVIPSPAANWESVGSYAGIRLDLASAAATSFAAMLASTDLRTDDDRAVGTILAAGGLAI
jgi:hypothetical protein